MTNFTSPGAAPAASTAVTVRVPSQLRQLTGGAGEVTVACGTVRQLIAALETAHPGFGQRLLDENGALRRFVNVFVADEDVRFLDGLDTAVSAGQTVSVVPAVAGG
ncbi:MAG: MoaD/ThiS family protein [Acidimicrobiales bacterium]